MAEVRDAFYQISQGKLMQALWHPSARIYQNVEAPRGISIDWPLRAPSCPTLAAAEPGLFPAELAASRAFCDLLRLPGVMKHPSMVTYIRSYSVQLLRAIQDPGKDSQG